MGTSCCWKCGERKIGCHSICERYKEEQKRNEWLKTERYKRVELYTDQSHKKRRK